MSELFNLDNGFFRFMGKIVDAVWVSVLWAVCCIPIVTAGASTTAFYYAVHKSIRHDEGYITKDFFKAFKINFIQSTICWLVLLALGVFLYVDARTTWNLLQAGDTVGNIFYLLLVLAVIYAMVVIYVFPYISRFQDNNRTVIKNAFFLALGNPLRTIVILISTVISAYVLYVIPYLIVIVPTLYMFAVEQMMERNYKKFLPEEDSEEEDKASVNGKQLGLFAGKKLKNNQE